MTTITRSPIRATPWFGRWEQPPEIGLPPGQIAETMQYELRALRLPAFPVALQPLVVPAESFRELMRATAALLALLRRAVLHAAADRGGRVAALGVDPADCPLFVPDDEFELRHCADMARADVVIGVDGPKFIEFNVGGAFGGMADFSAYQHAWHRICERADRPSFLGADVWARLAMLVERTCAELGVPPSVAIVDHLDSANTPRTMRLQLDGLRAHGVRAQHLELHELHDGIGLPGPLHESLGLYELDPGDARAAGCDIGPARAALDAGFRMIPSQTSWLLHTKKTLARLSEGQPWMDAEDRELVDRYVPWSRVVSDRPVHWRGRRHDLPRLLTEHQESFVLKGATGCRGQEVVFGIRTDPDDWARLVERAIRTGYPVAQEAVESATYPVDVMLESSEVVRVAANSVISPFCLGGMPAGCSARFTEVDRPGVVRCSDGAVLTCLLASA
jgi:hypothetical protein